MTQVAAQSQIDMMRLNSFHLIGLTARELEEVPEILWDGHRIEALAFEGGGTKGVVYGGALSRLEQAGLTASIKCVAGTSAGSQSAALFAFGFKGAEMVEVLGKAPWDKLLDKSWGCFRNANRMIHEFGLFKGDFLESFIDGLLESKCGLKMCTFAQAFEHTGVHLKVGVVTMSKRKFELLDHINMPDMPVALAVRASSSIPGVFSAVEYGGDRFVDGGLLENLPADAFPGKKTLAFDLTSNEDLIQARETVLQDPNLPSGAVQHFGALLGILVEHANAKLKNDKQVAVHKLNHSATHPQLIQRLMCAHIPRMIDIVPILTGSAATLNTKLDKKMIDVMVAVGYIAVDKYLGKVTLHRK